jgi:hypothetical protein
LCREVLLYLFCETRFAVHLHYMRQKGVQCTLMSLYNTVSVLAFVLDLGTVKRPLVACLVGYVCSGPEDYEKTPGGMSGGVSVFWT